MSKASRKSEHATMTVGELISELCRWPDHAVVTFRCPDQHHELHFHHMEGRSKKQVEIELAPASQDAPVVPA